ncbi:unnamed protein product [Trichobilharzia regenti]|nr:unnamed protein product [Trichobilharzia regenti]
MEQNGFDQDYNKLENHYFEQLTGIIQNIAANSGGITPVVWQEVFENGFRVSTIQTLKLVDNETTLHFIFSFYYHSMNGIQSKI